MAENNTQDDKKTVVAFIVGLLIGGLLVWAFSGPAADAPSTTKTAATSSEESAKTDANQTKEDSNPTTSADKESINPTSLPKGDGNVTIGDVKAGTRVPLASASYPMSEGWIGVRSYQDERLGSILGVVRFSEEQGLVPQEIILQAPTRVGNQYAIVMFSENGDRQFNLANDVQVDKVFATFTAN